MKKMMETPLGETSATSSRRRSKDSLILNRIYLNTLADFQKQADVWVSDSYTALLKQEESKIGWRVRPEKAGAYGVHV